MMFYLVSFDNSCKRIRGMAQLVERLTLYRTVVSAVSNEGSRCFP